MATKGADKKGGQVKSLMGDLKRTRALVVQLQEQLQTVQKQRDDAQQAMEDVLGNMDVLSRVGEPCEIVGLSGTRGSTTGGGSVSHAPVATTTGATATPSRTAGRRGKKRRR